MLQVVVTQLIVDADGARKGEADFEATMDRAKAAADKGSASISGSYDQMVKKWNQSLASTDPIMRAHLQMQQALARQQALNNQAVGLGIATQQQAAAQLDAIRGKYDGVITKIRQHNDEATKSTGIMGGLSNAFSVVTRVAGAFGLALGVGAIVSFGKEIFELAANLDSQAKVAGVSTQALQAYRASLEGVGVDTSTTDAVLQHMTRSIGDALNATGAQRTAFYELGISAQDLSGGTSAVLPKVAASLLAIQDASTRAQIEIALFGKSGQEIEPALDILSQQTQGLIDKETQLGHVMGDDLTAAADKAQREMLSAWQKLEVGLTPIIVSITTLLSGLIDEISGLASFPGAVISAAQAAKNKSADWHIPTGTSGSAGTNGLSLPAIPGSDDIASAAAIAAAGKPQAPPSAQSVFDPAAWSKYLADRAEEARLTGLSASEQAAEKEAIAQSVEKQTINGVAAQNINKTYSAAVGILTQQELSHARSNGLLTEQSKAADKIKETFSGYLDELKQAADVSKLSASEKQIEANVIKAAVIDEKAHGIAARDTSKTYADAVKYLGDEKSNLVAMLTIQAQINAATQQQNDEITAANAGLAVDADHRTLVLKNVQDELKLGILVGDQYEAQRKTLEDKNATIQDITDATKTRDYLDNLKEETSLAGMSADERERESAVLQVMHMNNGQITDDLANQVRGAIGLRQEMQKVGQVSDTIQSGFEDFFANVLSGGKNAFGQLVDIIKQQFIKLLAYMAAQAIQQPIIVPIIGAVTGAAGLGSLVSGASGGTGGVGNLLGSLGQLGSSGATSGGTGFLGQISSSISSATSWLTNGINSIGSSLGFSAGTSFGGISTVGVTPSVFGTGGFAAPNIAGSSSLLGGTTLAGFLGGGLTGMGVGGLTNSLLGGNALGGNVGGLVGGLAGSLLGPLGSILGGALGGAIGGLFGPGKSHGDAYASFDANGVITGSGGSKATQKSSSAVQSAATAISQTVQALEAAGITLTNTVSRLQISDNNKQSVLTTGSGKQINVGKAGDANAAVQGTLDYLLSGLKSTDTQVQSVINHYKALGGITESNAQQFGDDVIFAQNLAKTTHQVTVQLGNAADAMKQVQAAYDTDIQRAKSLGLSTSSLLANEQKDIVAMQKATSDAYVATFKGFTDSFNQLDQIQTAAKNISDTMTQAASDMTALGGSIVDVANAAQNAKSALASYVNQQNSQSLEQLASPINYEFDQLIQTQKQRIADAQAAGADLAIVYKLNAAETNNALKSYSDAVTQATDNLSQVQQKYADAVTAAQQNLASVEAQYTTTAVKSVADAQNELQTAYSSQTQTLNTTISQFTSTAANLRAAISDIATSTASLNPVSATNLARSRYDAAAKAAQGGSADALNALPGAAQSYIQALMVTARSPQELALAQAKVSGALEDAAKLADSQVSIAQKQLAALNKQVSGLIAVNDNVISVGQAVGDLAQAQAVQVQLQAAAIGVAQQQLSAALSAQQNASEIATAQQALAAAVSNLASAQQAATASPTSAAAVSAATAAVVAAISSTAAVAATSAASQVSADTTSAIASASGPSPAVMAKILENISLGNSHLPGTKMFANGGNFGGGWRVVGERGPEIENTGPSNIISNSNSRNLFDASGIISELRAVKSELASLRAEQGKVASKTADSTSKSYQLLRRVTRDGNSLVTSAA